jgi:hypothetical protein
VGIKVVFGESFLLVLTLKKAIYEKDDSYIDVDWRQLYAICTGRNPGLYKPEYYKYI